MKRLTTRHHRFPVLLGLRADSNTMMDRYRIDNQTKCWFDFFFKLIIGDATVSNSWYFTNQCSASGLIPVFGFSPCHPIVDQPRHIVNNSCRLIRFFSQKSYHPVYPLKNWSGWTITTSCPSVERWEIVGQLPKTGISWTVLSQATPQDLRQTPVHFSNSWVL